MLLDKHNSVNQLDTVKLLADGVVYINTAQWLLAYFTFSYLHQNAKDKSVGVLYNMALCHCSAKEFSKAIAMLGEAQMQSSPSVSHQASNNLPQNLLNDEYVSNNYRLALTGTAITLQANLVKLRIRRLLVDLNLELGNWQEIVRLSALPEMDKCKNVQDALTIAHSKINT